MWFEFESGRAALRRGQVVEALKQFSWIDKHFDTFDEDLYDFHDYALRRCTLRAYINLVRNQATLRRAPVFCNSAKLQVEALLKVFDEDAGRAELAKHQKQLQALKKAAEEDADESKFAGLTPPERKLAKAKLKKERLAKEQALALAAAKAEADNDNDNNDEGKPETEAPTLSALMTQAHRPKKKSDMAVDPDPTGFGRFEKIIADPLKHAQQVVDVLQANLPEDVQVHLLAFDVAVRRRNMEACVKALEDAVALRPLSANPGALQRLAPLARFAALGACSYAPWCKGAACPCPLVLGSDLMQRLDVLVSQVGPVLEFCKQALSAPLAGGDKAGLDMKLAAAVALQRVDAKEFGPLVAAALKDVDKPLVTALAVRDVFAALGAPAADAAAHHLQACMSQWPLAGKMFKR
jgi:hypothetical protein